MSPVQTSLRNRTWLQGNIKSRYFMELAMRSTRTRSCSCVWGGASMRHLWAFLQDSRSLRETRTIYSTVRRAPLCQLKWLWKTEDLYALFFLIYIIPAWSIPEGMEIIGKHFYSDHISLNNLESVPPILARVKRSSILYNPYIAIEE